MTMTASGVEASNLLAARCPVPGLRGESLALLGAAGAGGGDARPSGAVFHAAD